MVLVLNVKIRSPSKTVCHQIIWHLFIEFTLKPNKSHSIYLYSIFHRHHHHHHHHKSHSGSAFSQAERQNIFMNNIEIGWYLISIHWFAFCGFIDSHPVASGSIHGYFQHHVFEEQKGHSHDTTTSNKSRKSFTIKTNLIYDAFSTVHCC